MQVSLLTWLIFDSWFMRIYRSTSVRRRPSRLATLWTRRRSRKSSQSRPQLSRYKTLTMDLWFLIPCPLYQSLAKYGVFLCIRDPINFNTADRRLVFSQEKISAFRRFMLRPSLNSSNKSFLVFKALGTESIVCVYKVVNWTKFWIPPGMKLFDTPKNSAYNSRLS